MKRSDADKSRASRRRPGIRSWAQLLLALLIAACPLQATSIDLTQLSIEELMDVEVVLASRKPQRINDVAAAISVLTTEDLRHSGARTLPDALRLVPGFQVASVDANKWVVTARGFSGLFANKLLVQIDGRSVYTPLFSGVFWEAQDVVLEDVDRIEVIRGPGGTMWGANAVNGVVNVVTKNANETPGLLVELGGGIEEQGFGTVRYGRRLTDVVAVRGYAKYFRRDDSSAAGEYAVRDGWDVGRLGFRVDWSASGNDNLTFISNAYRGSVGQGVAIIESAATPFDLPVYKDVEINGQDIVGRWQRRLGGESEVGLQVYLDRSERNDVGIGGVMENADLDLQHRPRLFERHELVWGLGYRRTSDRFEGSFPISLAPNSRTAHLFSGFVHDQFAVVPEKLRLAVGTKLEHNDYSGFELQPNLRVWWSPWNPHAFWASLSRAVRSPSRSEHDIRAVVSAIPAGTLYDGSPVGLVELRGNRRFDSETVRAFDVGYRSRFGDGLLFDLAGFRYSYDRLRTNELGIPVPPGGTESYLLVPLSVDNNSVGHTTGVEWSLDWRPTSSRRLQVVYAYLHMNLRTLPAGAAGFTADSARESPTQQLVVRSSAELFSGTELDVIARYVDEIPLQEISDYLAVDLRLTWRVSDAVELSTVARNLLAGSHAEYVSTASGTLPSKVQTSLFATLRMRL